MAKQPPKVPANNARVKVRVFEFEMDGTDDSIQDTMKTLAAAFTRGGGGVPVARRLRSDASPAAAQEPDDADTEDVDTVDDGAAEDVVVKPPAQPKKPKKVQTYEILDDVRFDEVEPTLADFSSTFNVKSDVKRYLVIALWYKDHLKLSEINTRHWYTACKYLKWTIPNDPAQPIRDLRKAQKLSKGKEMGHTFINHIGEKDLESLNTAA